MIIWFIKKNKINLPKLKLSRFHGDKSKFLRWSIDWENSFPAGTPDSVKFQYLKSNLGEEPTNLIEKHSKIAKKDGVKTIVEYNPVAAGQKRNIGCEISKGSLIAFTDDDTILREDWIKNGIKHLIRNLKENRKE